MADTLEQLLPFDLIDVLLMRNDKYKCIKPRNLRLVCQRYRDYRPDWDAFQDQANRIIQRHNEFATFCIISPPVLIWENRFAMVNLYVIYERMKNYDYKMSYELVRESMIDAVNKREFAFVECMMLLFRASGILEKYADDYESFLKVCDFHTYRHAHYDNIATMHAMTHLVLNRASLKN